MRISIVLRHRPIIDVDIEYEKVAEFARALDAHLQQEMKDDSEHLYALVPRMIATAPESRSNVDIAKLVIWYLHQRATCDPRLGFLIGAAESVTLRTTDDGQDVSISCATET